MAPLSFPTCCTRLHCTTVLVPNPDPSYMTYGSYVSLEKEKDRTNKISFSFLEKEEGNYISNCTFVNFPIFLIMLWLLVAISRN